MTDVACGHSYQPSDGHSLQCRAMGIADEVFRAVYPGSSERYATKCLILSFGIGCLVTPRVVLSCCDSTVSRNIHLQVEHMTEVISYPQ